MATYWLLSWKTLRKVYLFNHSNCSDPSLEVVVYLFFVIERMAIFHSLKYTVLFSLVVPLLSLAVTHCHLLSLVVTHCITRCDLLYHSLSLVVTRHLLSLVVISCHSLYHSLLLVVTRCTTRCHSLSLIVTRCHSLSVVVPLVVAFCHSLYQSLSLLVIRCHSLSFIVIRSHSMYHSSVFL